MNTSANINQTYTPPTNPRTTPSGFRRRTLAGALLIMTITGTAVGLAAPSHADDAPPPAPGISVPGFTATVPPPVTPWLPRIGGFDTYRHLHCGFPGWRGPFQCWY